jgi:hypothetical protein
MVIIDSRAKVFHGTADRTTGGLEKKDLMKNKHGRIVSVKKHKSAKRNNRLKKAGFFTKKGVFGSFKKDVKAKSKTRKNKTQKKKK